MISVLMIHKLIMTRRAMRKVRGAAPWSGFSSAAGIGAACLMIGAALAPYPARAEEAVSCGGFAMLGGAQIVCSHVVPQKPTQFCTFSWTLMTTANAVSTVTGSFLVPQGTSNASVYQGGGFNMALSNPIVLCQGRKSR